MQKFIFALSLAFFNFSFAHTESDHVMIRPGEIKWAEGPKSLPPGAKFNILYGDPTAEGPFGMRFKFPANYFIPPHFHPKDENITVISGTFLMAVGSDKNSPLTSLEAGSFARMKTGVRHFAHTKDETIVQINGVGPWEIIYVNPDEDPRNKK